MSSNRHSLTEYLKATVEQGASDLHINPGIPPEMRLLGRCVKVKESPLSSQESKELCYSVLTEVQKAEFEREKELDFSFAIKGISRFRGNLYLQRGVVAGVFRRIPFEIPEFESLGLPPALKKIIRRPSGLILITGPTGSGKTTSLAAMLQLLNREEHGHIITIEDPIEYIIPHGKCIVSQREVKNDTVSFGEALKRVLRQDPDYILVGELRDLESISMALTVAETGHLVFATLHTNSAIQSINRIVNVFPPHQQAQIRQELSFVLQAIITQQLLRKKSGKGRVLATELLIPTLAIRSLIREEKIHQIYAMMQSGQIETDMLTMNQSLLRLVQTDEISKETAIENSSAPEELLKMIDEWENPKRKR